MLSDMKRLAGGRTGGPLRGVNTSLAGRPFPDERGARGFRRRSGEAGRLPFGCGFP
jgi:hypothetical protein